MVGKEGKLRKKTFVQEHSLKTAFFDKYIWSLIGNESCGFLFINYINL